jgi:hypothetical protein
MLRPMRHRAWLLAAIALLAAAGWLMSRGDKLHEDRAPRLPFPRYPGVAEQQRNARRRTLPLPAAQPDDAKRTRDPLLSALPTTRGKSAVVFEASALRTSPVGRLWLDCLTNRNGVNEMDQIKKDTGVDLLQDVDRVAISSGKVGVITGDFHAARWDAMFRDEFGKGRPYGQKGTIYGGGDGRAVGVWGDELLIMSPDEQTLHESMDRLEGKRAPETPPIPESASYGDVYGILSAEDMADTFSGADPALAEKLRGALDQVELHIDASSDVAIVARATGTDGAEVDDLGKSLGAALSLGRLKARADGDTALGELMELARVRPEDGRFSMELALPMKVIEKYLGGCRRGRDGGVGDGGGI